MEPPGCAKGRRLDRLRYRLATTLLLFVSVAVAQRMVSASAGVIAYRIGTVLVDNRAVQVPFQMRAGETLRTTDNGGAEVLLLPGVFLRLDQNSSFRMEDTRLADAQVEMLQGSAFFEVRKLDKGSRLRAYFRGNTIEFKHPGVFELNARRGKLRVYQGDILVARHDKQDKNADAKRGKEVDLTGDLAVSIFDPKELPTSWAAQRSGLGDVAAARSRTALVERLDFIGNLEKITLDAISIRLSDGIIVEARLRPTGALSAVQLSDGHHVGDRVQITCVRIPPVYEPRTQLMRYLELSKLETPEERPTERSAPEELAAAFASRVWRESGNLVKPPRDAALPASIGPDTLHQDLVAQDLVAKDLLQRARVATSRSSAQMVNFMADETATRYRSPTAGPKWQLADVFKSEVRPSQDVHQHILKDGKPWNQPFEAIPGFRWYTGSGAAFGAQMAPFFTTLNSVPCPTVIEPEGRQTLRDKPVWVYRYKSPAEGCLHYLYSGYQRFYSAFTGRMFFDESTLEMVRFEEKAMGLPAAFPFTQADKEVDWDHVRVGDMTYLLPVSAKFTARFFQEDAWLVKIEYKNHRHYEASSSITFQ